MSRACTICVSPKLREIDNLILRGQLSNRRIAAQFGLSSERMVRDHRALHLGPRLERALEAAKKRNELDINTELSRSFQRLNKLTDACEEVLQDPDNLDGYKISGKASVVRVAKLLLQAVQLLNQQIRTLGDLTGAFKAPQHNPREVNRTLYDEWVGMFLSVLRNLDPKIERPAVVQLLADMPATLGEFAPFVQEELGGYVN